ncbi:non-ribosomal peptide synthetase-like protein [Dinothrombium tinctorium]|uniref:Non-ribosomal peptide synthetase-like protein n=1 Tax=Dinothrombium tinctorium TaxID=1965070 RepID=A0A3S3PJS5_9ACAR|nr:non-ribosomal peptide synthetase-like protein [Dinothrombium tinctorium]
MACKDYPVAVIGIACRLPQSENCSQFWQFLIEKRDSSGKFPKNRAKDIDHVLKRMSNEMLANPDSPYFTGSFFQSIDKFDASFFGISPQEAQFIDPQQRLFLSTAWEALEDAGIAGNITGTETGVYVGNANDKYAQVITESHHSAAFGTHAPFIASRLSYTLDLRGPALLVGVGCSSSLLAVHLACEGLKNGDCKMAIAGGATLDCLPLSLKSDVWNLLDITHEDVRCRPFDDNCQGTVKGEGSAAVILKPLSDAINDGNHIYGVILSSAINQNGRSNGLSTPHPRAQCDVMVSAWQKAAIDPIDISYFETHGTGTMIGDPIEMLGIEMAFEHFKVKPNPESSQKPLLGSVKANVGHLADGAAGVISLIKVLLAFKNNTIPPQANFDNPNKRINWNKSIFRINTEAIEWKRRENHSRIAVVSSFGFVGTNVHMVLQDYEQEEADNVEDYIENLQPILLSAATHKSLTEFVLRLKKFVGNNTQREPSSNIFKSIAFTLNTGREHQRFLYKALLFAKNLQTFEKQLNKVYDYLRSNQLSIAGKMSEDEFKDLMLNQHFVCFAIDPNKKPSKANSQNMTGSHFYRIYCAVINRKLIPWSCIYKKQRVIVPQLPTYAFDERRFWPTIPSPQTSRRSSICSSQQEIIDDYYSLPDDNLTENLLLNCFEEKFCTHLAGITGINSFEWCDVENKTLLELGIDSYIASEILNEITRGLNAGIDNEFKDFDYSTTLKDIVTDLKNKFTEKLTKKIGLQEVSSITIEEVSHKRESEESCTLFTNFDIPENVIQSTNEQIDSQLRLKHCSPHLILQTILNGESNESEMQILAITDEIEDHLFNQIVNALNECDAKLRKSSLLVMELILCGKKRDWSKVKFDNRRVFFQTYSIHKKYQMNEFTKINYNIPFTSNGYLYLSSLIARNIRSVLNPSPFKVDADNTLWEGECGNGPIVVRERHRILQKFLLEKYDKGFLLVLISKNNEKDVIDAFQTHRNEMLLNLDHFTEKKINWTSKHLNLSEACESLKLDSDAVVFIDDNIYECIEMNSKHPSVLILCMPQNSIQARALLNSIWALDSLIATDDGKRRSFYYKQESERKISLKSQRSLDETLRSWNMVLKFFHSTVGYLKVKHYQAFERAQELINRTNQFKMNAKILNLLEYKNAKCLLVNLEDDFGTYGTISVVIFAIEKNDFIVHQWVMSCRALGRNVEHNVFNYLKETSKQMKCRRILLKFERTDKNEPALKFIQEVKSETSISNSIEMICVKDNIDGFVSIKYETLQEPQIIESHVEMSGKDEASSHSGSDFIDFLQDIDACKKLIKSWPRELKTQIRIRCLNPSVISECLKQISHEDIKTVNQNADLSTLKLAWYEQLGIQPSDESHFFKCGGTSFKAVYFLSKIREELEIDIRLSHIYEFPKFGELCKAIRSLPPIRKSESSSSGLDPSHMSSIQSRFVWLQELTPTSTAYTESVAVCGNFYDFNLKMLFNRILETFPLMTTTVEENDNCDKILTRISVEKIVDTCIGPLIEVESKQEALKKASELRPSFKLSNKSPLVALQAFKINNDRFANTLVVIYVHHMLIDEISLVLLEKALIRFLANKPFANLTPVKTYEDFINEEYSYLNSSKKQEDLENIGRKFVSSPANSCLGFSSDTWTDTKVFKAKRETFEIDLDVNSVCERQDIRPFHYYLACYLLTLRRYASENDLLVNIPVTTRSHLYENSFGPFLNTVLYRYELDGDQNLKTFMSDVALKWIEIQDYSLLPMNEVLSYLRDKKKIAGIQLCNVFNYSDRIKDENIVDILPKHAKTSLYILVNQLTGTNVEITVEWAAELIDDNIAHNFGASLANICKKLVHSIDWYENRAVSSIDVLSEDEFRKIMNFNRELNPTPNLFAHRYFEMHCNKHSEKIAIITEDKKISYKQLNEMANKIAAYLQKVIPEEEIAKNPIVIMMERNEFVIASVLAIWKIGGYFLPISEDMQQRLIQIDSDGKVKLNYVLINFNDDSFAVEVPAHLNFVDVREIISCSKENHFEDKLHCKDPKTTLAYIYLTSGTTGEPKRCMITHQSLSIFIMGSVLDYELETFEMNLLQWLPICFDAFIQELVVGMLTVGGTITIIPHRHRFDTNKLGQVFLRNKISCILGTPQFASSLVSELSKEELQYLRMLIVGGDIFYQIIYERLASKLGEQTKIVNAYGMTETTVNSTFFIDKIKYMTSSALVPIGKPLSGVNIYIVDPLTKMLSPIGTIGEICICGLIVGKGDMKVTKLDFAGNQPVFVTGDKARFLPDGNIDFIGRKASSFFKIRGYRVNPREIELTVIKYLAHKIDEVRVFLAEDHNQQKIICLVYTSKFVNGQKLDNEIRNLVKSRLPYYMVPNIIKWVNKIPLTKNGKTDINILKENCLKDQTLNQNFSEESNKTLTKTESLLIKHLCDSMSSSLPIDVNSNFRDQGVHSLALMKFANVLINEKVPGFKGIVDLFDYPNIKLLAQKIDAFQITLQPTIRIERSEESFKIAIVGLAFRLPEEVRSLSQLWPIFDQGMCQVREFSEERAADFISRLNHYDAEMIKNVPTFKGSFLKSIDKFDNEFFGITAAEAKHMCPEQRLWMEVATEALLDSGHLNEVYGKKVGVFVATSDIKYGKVDSCDEAISVIGQSNSFIPTRIAYQFDLKGPGIVINTTCSSGAVAIHDACESIKSGSCEAAIVGGMNILLYPAKEGIFGEKVGTQSPDFHCRVFDEKANGTVPGEGVIAFILEPLQKAIAKNRYVYGVIEGSALNSVGRGNGITAPSISSQREVIQSALNAALLSASDVKVIESHGTGTQIGDSIEIEALKQVFGENSNPIFLGATKSSFGHLDGAAGLLGVLKLLSIFMFKEVPQAVNFTEPNETLNDSNIIVPKKKVQLKTTNFISGVSAFGLSGTNAHVILRSVNRASSIEVESASYPLLISAFGFENLKQQIINYLDYIELMVKKYKITSIPEICATAYRHLKAAYKPRRRVESTRIVLLLKEVDQAIDLLSRIRFADHNQMIRLSECEENLIIKPTGNNYIIDSFLKNGSVEEDLLASFDIYQNAPSLPSSIFKSERHWPDEPKKRRLPLTDSTDSEVNLKALLEKEMIDVRELIHTIYFKPDDDCQPTIDRFAVAFIAKFFREISLQPHWKVGRTFDTRELFQKTNIHEHYFSLFRMLLKHLAKCKVIKTNTFVFEDLPNNFTILRDLNDINLNEDPYEIAQYGMKHFPDYRDCFKLPLHCMQYFKDVLTSDLSPLTVLYPKGDLSFTSRHESVGDPLGTVYMKKYIQSIGKYVKALARNTNKTIRVLEVGAGLGIITRQLAPKFAQFKNIEYWFTDIGKAFVNHAEMLFSRISSNMKFRVFDISKPAEEQEIKDKFDVIISYNVIHATESIRDTTSNLSSSLTKKGVLFIVENTRNNIWATLTWGILDGWWYFKDYDIRSEVLSSAENWEKVLCELDFKTVYSCPLNKAEREYIEKFMFVCSKEKLEELQEIEGWWEREDLKFENSLKPKEKATKTVIKHDISQISNVLKEIWKRTLGLEYDIGDDDIFRDLGGESLLAIQMLHEVKDELGIELEIAHCYAYPSLKELTSFVKTLLDDQVAQNTQLKRIEEKSDQMENFTSENETRNKQEITRFEAVEKSISNEVYEELSEDSLLMFCGQGAQKAEMFETLVGDPIAQKVLDEAKRITGIDILEERKNKESLQETAFVQTALFVGSIAKIKQIEAKNPSLLQKVKAVAGLSVGEFAALTYAGVLDFADALKLVRCRGLVMQEIVDTTSTAMSSILGPSSIQLSTFLAQYYPTLTISGFLADNQHTVSGEEKVIDKFLSRIREEKFAQELKLLDARKLRVSGAFHTEFMRQAAENIEPIIDSISFKKPKLPIISNVNGEAISDPKAIKSLVKNQITSPLQWKQTISTAIQMGIRKFIEVSPSPILTAIIRKRIQECIENKCQAEFQEA